MCIFNNSDLYEPQASYNAQLFVFMDLVKEMLDLKTS